MTVLLDMPSRKVQFLISHDILRPFGRSCWLSQFRYPIVFFLIRDKFFAFIIDSYLNLISVSIFSRYIFGIYIFRRYGSLFIQYDFIIIGNNNSCIFKFTACIDSSFYIIIRYFKINSSIYACILDISRFLVWHEILPELLLLIGHKPGKIRLVVAVYACHQFNIRAVCICKVPVPGLAKVSAPPSPLLLAGRYVMISYVQKSCLPAIIIAAYKVKIRTFCHIRSWHRDILIS